MRWILIKGFIYKGHSRMTVGNVTDWKYFFPQWRSWLQKAAALDSVAGIELDDVYKHWHMHLCKQRLITLMLQGTQHALTATVVRRKLSLIPHSPVCSITQLAMC